MPSEAYGLLTFLIDSGNFILKQLRELPRWEDYYSPSYEWLSNDRRYWQEESQIVLERLFTEQRYIDGFLQSFDGLINNQGDVLDGCWPRVVERQIDWLIRSRDLFLNLQYPTHG